MLYRLAMIAVPGLAQQLAALQIEVCSRKETSQGKIFDNFQAC